MPDSFGARLRQRREDQGIALATVAERTKIKQLLLEALERDDVSQWPTGFYRRAFIRAYAIAIGLDPDVVFREFCERFPEPPPVDILIAMASTLERTQQSTRASGIRTVVGSAIGSLARFRRGGSPEETPPLPGPANPEPGIAYAPVGRPNGTAPPPAPIPPHPEAANPVAVEAAIGPGPADPPPVAAPPPDQLVSSGSNGPDLEAIARLCTDLGRARDAEELESRLVEVARVLDATGLIMWHWDPTSAHLQPTLVHGYSPRIVAQLPALRPDADNATAAAFRTATPCAVGDGPDAKSALVVPLIAPEGCGGVLAIEFPRGREQSKETVAVATILAAVLAQCQLVTIIDATSPEFERDYVREELAR